jgi:hypothetical protein
MLENEEIARIRVKEALQSGVSSQRYQPERKSGRPVVSVTILLAVLWIVINFVF